MMQQAASLEQLNDIVEPDAASWWPPSWLTLAIAAMLLAGIIIIIARVFRQWQKSRIRKAATAQLRQQQNHNVQQLTVLLKRTALAYYPREQIADKHGRAWLRFLLAPLSTKEQASFDSLLEHADKNFYGVTDEAFIQSYYQLSKLWLSKDLSKQPGADDV